MNKGTTKMIPGDELHLTMLMAPYSLNLVTGQDRQHLLAFGRAVFEAGKADRPGQCLHHIAEPETAASMLRQCIDKATFPTNMDKHSALQWVDQLEAEVDAERRHHGIRNASAVRTLHALGYSWGGTDSWRPPAPQAAVPLPLLVRDIARDLGITVPQACIALKPLGNYSTNSAVTAEMARMLRDHFPAPVHPAEGVPAAIDPGECSQDVFDHGVSVGLFDIPKNEANAICAGLTAATGARVDWHYIAGRVHMKALAATQPAAQGMDASNNIGTLWVKENDENTLQLRQSAAPKLAPGEYALFAQAKQGGDHG